MFSPCYPHVTSDILVTEFTINYEHWNSLPQTICITIKSMHFLQYINGMAKNEPTSMSVIQLQREIIRQLGSRDPLLVDRGDHSLILLVAVAQVPVR